MENINTITCAGCGRTINVAEEEIGVTYFELDGKFYCDNCAQPCHECGALTVICEGIIPNDTFYRVYCRTCAESNLFYCDHCEEYYTEDCSHSTVYTANGEEVWCEGCISDDAFYCYDCEEYYSIYHFSAREVWNHGTVCEDCADDNYYYCEDCGYYYRHCDFNTDTDRCYRCENRNVICAYHHGPSLEFFGKSKPNWNGKWRGMGVELEVDNGNSRYEAAKAVQNVGGNRLHIERDGSLSENGFEIVTQPHTLEEFWKIDWKEIMRTLKGFNYRSHDTHTCGLHMHYSREMFGSTVERQDVAISKLIWFFENFYSDCVRVARRSESAARQWAGKQTYSGSRKECEDIGKKKGSYGRYSAVNNTNCRTVEIRLMRGTLNFNTFKACVDFNTRLVLNSRHISWKDIGKLDKWFAGMKPETLTYIASRNAFSDYFLAQTEMEG